MNWKQQAIELDKQGISWREIGRRLGVSKSTVSDMLRNHRQQRQTQQELFAPSFHIDKGGEDNSSVLIISDMHIPYQHKDTLDFLSDLKAKYKPTRIICMGDELDHHALSFHDSDPDLRSAGDELEMARKTIASLHKLFPKMALLDSNHGSLVYRKAKHHGIPRSCIRSYQEVLGVDEGWQWVNDLIITLPEGDKVYFCHGKSQRGVQLSQNMGMSVVQGHFHSEFNIHYWSNPLQHFFSMQVGCLVDDASLAMAYNKLTLKRPILGVGLIVDGKPVLERMK